MSLANTPLASAPHTRARLAALLAVPIAIMGLTALSSPQRAEACGGFFCSSPSLPVNQSAERIVFSKNDDGTVTAIVQILYNGPADRFAWFLPVPGVPTLDVSSDTFFTRLQDATNPNYTFTTSFYGDCVNNGGNNGTNNATNNATNNTTNNGGVSVLASGALGPFDYDVIEVNASVEDKAALAVEWLGANNYFIAPGQEDLIGPYLDAGMNLIAFRLQKDREAGDIQPIVMTDQTDQPMIPIKLTAVAADDDMGVLVWVLGDHRTVPVNYRSLVLNDAAIDWFNPGRSYDDVVNAAADDAGGQGFVTEMAAETVDLEAALNTDAQQQLLDAARSSGNINDIERVMLAMGAWSGMATALESTLLSGVDVSTDDFLACPRCTLHDDAFLASMPDLSAFLDAVQEWVVDPVKRSVDIFKSRPWMTRLYTTMSAADMTVDPLFDFNPDLPAVSNVHQAELNVRSCAAEWYMDLPAGQRVWGDNVGTWPFSPGAVMPANARIEQASTSGEPEVITDNLQTINQALEAQMNRVGPMAQNNGGTNNGGTNNGGSANNGGANNGGVNNGGVNNGGVNNGEARNPDNTPDDGCFCATTSRSSSPSPLALVLGAALLGGVLALRRR